VKTDQPVATVDEQNPWLGLVSFTEETRSYFHGREEEEAELGRRVQRKLLTVLFGQSGLGKTSILQAGLVPRLRPEGFCPVYVRLDYDPNSPPPAEQIKRALFRETEAAGKWTQSGAAVTGESLWEFLHHRDDVLKDATGRTLTPIIIFDQFEEIFTLAQSDDAGRRRAQEFLADLADLVENRPPVALEGRIERDETDAARFDFARADYRILISLREDYLAHLEGLKAQMPSVTQNRMRLSRMTGVQAVSAVRAPAPHLVSETVAEAVVRFVAGGADIARAEVEPSLLSLICRELNNTRIAQGRAEISADLLAGSRDTILSEFYERALVDQPAGIREFIEDEMLTESGFRESVAEERVRKGFAAAGAAPDALATLVNRRLLRVEDRLDLRRVEITHDVLCSVIAASRSIRHEREALEESRRQLAVQKEREAATQRSLVRARTVATVSAALMLAAAGSAVFGWVNLRRAREAEAQTQAARLVTEKAKGDAEKLVGFLLEDFYEELQPTGRLEIVGKLADKAVDYFDSLPPELVTKETELYRGMAFVRKAGALAAAGNTVDAVDTANKAAAIFERLRAGGDVGEGTSLGLALSKLTRNNAGFTRRNRVDLEDSAKLLRPFVASGHASRATKLAFADLLQYLSIELTDTQERLAACEESRSVLKSMGALSLVDLTAASIYGDVCDTESRLCLDLGKFDEAKELAMTVGDIAEKVLALRPGDLRAMKDRYLSPDVLGRVAMAREDYPGAEALHRKSLAAGVSFTQFDPADSDGWLECSLSSNNIATTLFEEGRVGEALGQWHATTQFEKDPRNKSASGGNSYYAWRNIAQREAALGHIDVAEHALAELHAITGKLLANEGADAAFSQVSAAWEDIYRLDLLAAKGDYETIHTQAIALDSRLQKIVPKNSLTRNIRLEGLRQTSIWIAEAALRTGRPEEALTASRDFVAMPPVSDNTEKTIVDAIVERGKTRLGQALAVEGHNAEAQATLADVLAQYRDRLSKGASSTDFRLDYGKALYQMALTQDADDAGVAQRRALLDESMSVLGGLTLEAQQLQTARELIEWVSQAKAKLPGDRPGAHIEAGHS
jgi:tetratricopeptide (TPR) repeat protein